MYKQLQTGYIYFGFEGKLHSDKNGDCAFETNGIIKIGKTFNMTQRYAGLQSNARQRRADFIPFYILKAENISNAELYVLESIIREQIESSMKYQPYGNTDDYFQMFNYDMQNITEYQKINYTHLKELEKFACKYYENKPRIQFAIEHGDSYLNFHNQILLWGTY